jgi:hypothetical protein
MSDSKMLECGSEIRTAKYKVHTRTSDRKYARTDADVYAIIYGDNNDTGKMKLNKGQNLDPFENGKIDSFHLIAPDVGKIKKVLIGQDDSGPEPGWHLDWLQVEYEPETPSKVQRLYFECDSWISKGSGLTREFFPALTQYQVTTRTSVRHLAKTDAEVYVNIFGEKQSTGRIILKTGGGPEKDAALFESGTEDNFLFLDEVDVGKAWKVLIGQDDSGPQPGWHLDWLKVEVPGQNQKQTFQCDEWLSLNSGLTRTFDFFFDLVLTPVKQ